MVNNVHTKPPVWFWIVGGLALVWNLLGVMAYLAQAYASTEDLEQMEQAERLLLESTPAWATAAFAIAVWGGLLGSLALLLRKKWAQVIFMISLMGVLVQMAHSFFMSNSLEVYGPGALAMPIMVLLIAFALVFFSRYAIQKTWIG